MASALIRQVNSEQVLIDHWTFGGGTAMMLQIDHRESRDVDIFLSDPQLLSLLDPQKRDFQFEIPPSDYKGDGARFLKLGFDKIGEIDFIVADALTTSPTKQDTVEGEIVLWTPFPRSSPRKFIIEEPALGPAISSTSPQRVSGTPLR
jgi:Nucleotidyl transferase AbiEii toxin, Type IV TA system